MVDFMENTTSIQNALKMARDPSLSTFERIDFAKSAIKDIKEEIMVVGKYNELTLFEAFGEIMEDEKMPTKIRKDVEKEMVNVCQKTSDIKLNGILQHKSSPKHIKLIAAKELIGRYECRADMKNLSALKAIADLSKESTIAMMAHMALSRIKKEEEKRIPIKYNITARKQRITA